MDLISKQENIIKVLSEKLNEEIDTLKMKLARLEKETSSKSANVDHEAKEKKDKQSNVTRNKDDKAAPTDVDKSKGADDFNQTQPQETIPFNKELRKENCFECAQMTIGPKEYFFKLVSEFTSSNVVGHIQCNICQKSFSNKKELIFHVINTHDAEKHMEKKLRLKTCLNISHKDQ